MTQSPIGFNEFFGRKQDILWFIPGHLALPWAIIFFSISVVWYSICQTIEESWIVHVVMVVILLVTLITYSILVRNGEHAFLGEFHKPKSYTLTNQRLIMTRAEMKPRITKVKKGNRLSKHELNALENITDLVAPFEIDLHGHTAGGYLLEKHEKLSFCFGYDLIGESSNISEEDATELAHRLGEGLKDYQFMDSLDIHYGTWSNAEAEIAELRRMIQEAPNEEAQFLLGWRLKKTEWLVSQRKNRPKTISLFFTFSADKTGDSIEETAYELVDAIKTWVEKRFSPGKGGKISPLERLESTMSRAFDDGFLAQKYYLEKLGLGVRPMSWRDAWEMGWRKLNNGPCPDCPLVIRLTEDGLHFDRQGQMIRDKQGRIVSSEPMVVGRLFSKGTPTFEKDAVYLPGKNKYVGGLVWNERPSIRWDSERRKAQLRHATKPIFQEHSHDMEIIVSLSRVEHSAAKRTAQAITSETNFASNVALEGGIEDRGVAREKSLAIAADDALRSDTRLIKVGWVCLAYRDTPRELDQALRQIKQVYPGDTLTREEGYFDSLWTETLPFTAHSLLKGGVGATSRFERRIIDSTQAVLGFIPVLADSSKDSSGLKFLGVSGTPLFFDPLRKTPHGHCFTTGFTGSGKTVLMGAIAAHCVCKGVQVYIFDASKDGNVGALEPLVKFFDGAYFDPNDECSNLFEGADWRTMDDEKQESAKAVFQNFLAGSIRDLTVGKTLSPDQDRIAKDLLVFLISEYLNLPETKAAYHAAFDAGMGSEAWETMPTMTTWMNWLSPDRLPEEMRSDEAIRLLDRIQGALLALIRRPAGKAIASPSTFNSEAKLVAFKVDTKGDDDDLLPLVLSAQSAVLNGCLRSDQTYVAYDEVSRLFPKFPSLADTAADTMAMGRSLGIWMNLIGQTLKPIYRCPQRDDIFENIKTHLTGFIATEAIEGLVQREIPEHLVRWATNDRFIKSDGRKRWIISQGSHHWVGDLYLDAGLLALLGNSGPEKRRRAQFQDKYPDKFQWCHELAEQLSP